MIALNKLYSYLLQVPCKHTNWRYDDFSFSFPLIFRMAFTKAKFDSEKWQKSFIVISVMFSHLLEYKMT